MPDAQDVPAPQIGEEEPPLVEEGAPLWTTTFGDMMSLLLTFFILLFSMSELKMDRFLLAAQSMREAMGGTAAQDVDDPMGLMPDPVDPELKLQNPGGAEGASTELGIGYGSWAERFAEAYMEALAKKIQAFAVEHGVEETLTIERTDEGLRIRIQTLLLFGSGEGAIRGDGAWITDTLAEITSDVVVKVVVSGHADNVPIRSPVYASNWELSAARAAGVARALVEGGTPPERVRMEAYGEYRPIAPNETAEGRAKNRRVELFYAKQDIVNAALSGAISQD